MAGRRKKTVSLAQTPDQSTILPATAPPVMPGGDAEQTGAQIPGGMVGFSNGGYGWLLPNPLPRSYDTYRTIRRDPTVALARSLATSPIIAGEWSVKEKTGAPAGAKEFIAEQLLPLREPLMQSALEGGCDFGWQGFEKVFAITDDGAIGLRKIKPLLQDITRILVFPKTGAFAGFEQVNVDSGSPFSLQLPYSLLISFRVEGTQWYGEALLENVRKVFNADTVVEEVAGRYYRKVAGASWVVEYPDGTSKVDGVDVPNSTVAKQVLAALEGSRGVTIPKTIAKYIENLNQGGKLEKQWEISLISATTSGTQEFIDRQKYYDILKFRALLVPERAGQDTSNGTRADAGQHTNLAITARELEHRHVTRCVNKHVVDPLLALNYGDKARGMIELEAAPLVDEKLAWLKEIYKLILANPSGYIEASTWLDIAALTEALGIPKFDEARDVLDVPGQMDPNNQAQDVTDNAYSDGAASDGPPKTEPVKNAA